MLRNSIDRILKEYKDAYDHQPKTDHPLAKVLTTTLPAYLYEMIDEPIYLVKGSAGQGPWARCPWVSVFNVSITTSAREGYYPVYLFREDMTGVYLSLNQGVTSIKKKYRRDSREVLRIKGADFRAQIGTLPTILSEIEIDLRPSSPSNNSALYEAGNICAHFYPADDLPSEDIFLTHLKNALEIYRLLVDSDETEGDEEEIPPGKGIEDGTKLKIHKRLEGKPGLKNAAKKYHGYTCQACSFNFEKFYGSIGEKFIEAHHLKSLWTIRGKKVEMDPVSDFAVLCPNCHRMIHRTDDPGDLMSFRRLIGK